jgi:hypothetical protein
MIPTPIAVGLMLCEQVIIEEGTRHFSLINTFARWKVGSFPAVSRPFCVVCAMTDGEGDGTIRLVISQEETARVIYDKRHVGHFPGRLREARALFRVDVCPFPAAGLYYATVTVDGEWVAHKHFQVH